MSEEAHYTESGRDGDGKERDASLKKKAVTKIQRVSSPKMGGSKQERGEDKRKSEVARGRASNGSPDRA